MSIFICYYCANRIPKFHLYSIPKAGGIGNVVVCKNCYKKYHHGMSYGLNPFDGDALMPKATLSYEALAIDTEGNVTEGAYRLKLEGNFKQHIEPIVKFIKASIPSSERTYDPTTYEWFYHEKWHPFMEQAFKGSHYTIVYGVTKEAFTELKRKQAEWAKQAGQSFQHKQYPVDEDVKNFFILLDKAGLVTHTKLDELKEWTKDQAMTMYKKAIRKFHPDLFPERAAQASELNEVWSRLKEGYYIK